MTSNIDHPITDILSKLTKESCPYKANFHMHTDFSDGSLSPVELVSQIVKYNVENFAVTDHHSTESYPLIKTWLKNNSISTNRIRFWTGIEISCLLNGNLVHIIGLGFDYNSTHLSVYSKGESAVGCDLQANSVIDKIHKANGIAILAHPARYKKSYKEVIYQAYLLNIDAIEVWYDYERSHEWNPSLYICDDISKYTNSLNLFSSCGTDTHGLSILRR